MKCLLLLLSLISIHSGILTNKSDFNIRYFNSYKLYNDNPSYLTQRVWLKSLNGETSNQYAISYLDDTINKTIVMDSITNSKNNDVLFYADIPCDMSSLSFLKGRIDDNGFITTDECVISSLSYGVCYLENSSFSDLGTTTVVDADVGIISKAFEAYLTYGDKESNGCRPTTINSLFETWYKKKSATYLELKTNMIWDYSGYHANGNSYEGLKKDQQYSVYEKWTALCANAGLDSDTGKPTSKWKNNIVIIVTFAVIGLSPIPIIVYYSLKRKKAKQTN